VAKTRSTAPPGRVLHLNFVLGLKPQGLVLLSLQDKSAVRMPQPDPAESPIRRIRPFAVSSLSYSLFPMLSAGTIFPLTSPSPIR
jgi:hypothetical protein